jgi:hypothetical protein
MKNRDKYVAEIKDGAGKLDAIRTASVDTWESLKSESEKTWNTIHCSLSEFCTNFV